MVNDRDRGATFLLAANALYLTRLNFLIFHNTLPKDMPEKQKRMYLELDDDDFDSFDALRNFLSVPGFIDDRIEPPFERFGQFPWDNEDLKQLIQSDADVARVSFGDIPFSDQERDWLVSANRGSMNRSDWLRPICRWEPCKTIWTAREIVLNFLEGTDSSLNGAAESEVLGASPAKVETEWEENAGQTETRPKKISDCVRPGGPLTGDARAREVIAIDVLKLIHDAGSRKAKKQEVISVVSLYVNSLRGAERVWSNAVIPNWRKAGRVVADEYLPKSEFSERFSLLVKNHSPPVN